MRMAAVLVAGMIIAVGLLAVTETETVKAEFPEQCKDEDRENPSNRNSPCKFVGELALERVEWVVYLEYPRCYEKLRLHLTGHQVLLSIPDRDVRLEWRNKDDRWTSSPNSEPYHGYFFGGNTETYIDYTARRHWNRDILVGDRKYHDRVYWDMVDYTRDIYVPGYWNQDIDTELRLRVSFRNPTTGYWYERESNWVPNAPEFVGGTELIYSCIDRLHQEKADREHAIKTKEQEVAGLVATRVQTEAARREEEQARREAESQARIDTERLKVAQQSAIRVAEAEKIKTQALLNTIEQEKVIADILFQITRIRLQGAEERARLTNEWLTDRDQRMAAFAQETADTAARIQQYIDFNKALLDSITRYQHEIDDRLAQTQRSVAEQQDAIEQMLQDARRSALDTPQPTEELDGQ